MRHILCYGGVMRKALWSAGEVPEIALRDDQQVAKSSCRPQQHTSAALPLFLEASRLSKDKCQHHRPLVLGGFAPERTRRRAPESDRSVDFN